MEESFLFEALTRWNYFPNQKSKGEELPPVFSTRQFTPHVAKLLLSHKPRKSGYDQVEYYSTRYNNVSRPLSIPHPVGYAHLVNSICSNWKELNYICENENSLIKPEQHNDGRILIMDYEDSLDKTSRALNLGFGMKFRAHTDITNCFLSIYTHAIPWAVVGFGIAKLKKDDKKIWFNKLDFHQRIIKRNETQGIAIGPATSNIICEAILARIDEILRVKYSYFRYIDDYTCYCLTHNEGQSFLRDLSDELHKYKLSLNIKKTEIVELPATLDSEWILELSTRVPSGSPNEAPKKGKSYNAKESIRYIDFALQLKKSTPDGSVLKFAVKSIIYQLDEYAIKPVLEYLINLASFYPLLLPMLSYLLDKPNIDQAKYTISFNAINRRSDGMCWVIYYLNKYSLEFSDDAVEEVFNSRDCMAILLIDHSNKYEDKVKVLINSFKKTDLYELDQYLVLLYQRFLNDKEENFYADDESFAILKAENVSFIPAVNFNNPSEIALELEKFNFDDIFAKLNI